MLAAKTGWTEDYLRWQLPLSRGYAYYHAARVIEGERCCWPSGRSNHSQWLAEVQRWAQSVSPKKSTPKKVRNS